MQFSTLIVSVLAAVTSAAPAKHQARQVDLSLLNNLAFAQQDLAYLSSINSVDLQLLAQLNSVNNFDILSFQSLFEKNVFDVQALLQLQQIQMLVQLQSLGVLGGFDLSTLQLNSLNFGLIQAVGGIDLTQFIDAGLIPQIQTIVQQSTVIQIAKE
ncbi:uncharacterized protein BCR38DRAFT_195977 [Pseudomassariella vexata]|uniref:Uncharacterized protein n=1 Tax=Pseudomassariella vexata TaxID=1141098 RepID=A0A1Y2E1I1_9PEZI|nr:uncharacterized protein BCR38DRAFT_195977 [Pseudomassariella vexata]ORY65359.1 hypothetical protein BCR38DRAFT_195977 [Pseudomassariella vexata]